MPFFDPLPTPEPVDPEPIPAPPVWNNRHVAFEELVVAKTDRLAVALCAVEADPNGFEFTVRTYRRYQPGRGVFPPSRQASQVRVGIELSDGRRATADLWPPI